MEIIPAIDIIEGKCVRLSQGEFSSAVTYSDSPADVARSFEQAGFKRLHIVDLDGAKQGNTVNLHVLESIAANTDLVIDFGGGIKTDHDLRCVLDAGAAMASIGSIAVRSPDRFTAWTRTYGPDKFLLGADVRDGFISVNGWQTDTDLAIVPFLSKYFEIGLRRAVATDIARDGLLLGPSIELYKQILDALPEIKLIASGGVTTIDDIEQLEQIGCSGVIIGKAIYEGRLDLKQLGAYVG
jgi:phosphoribosylformimino-5-aminoimidazole carboxamide ribotide isomerase